MSWLLSQQIVRVVDLAARVLEFVLLVPQFDWGLLNLKYLGK